MRQWVPLNIYIQSCFINDLKHFMATQNIDGNINWSEATNVVF